MRRILLIAAVGALVLAPASPTSADYHGGGGSDPGQDADVEVTISNFRFCEGSVCTPLHQGYLRTAGGPASPDNPLGTVQVRPGDVVRWTYADGLCDSFGGGCPGHNVVLEDGDGEPLGFAEFGTNDTITFEVPEAASGAIRYYCDVLDHWQNGMTGVLDVVDPYGY